MACRVIVEVCKRPDEVTPKGFDLTDFCSRFRAPATVYEAGTAVRPVPKVVDSSAKGATGYEYEADADGQTGEKEPKFPGAGSLSTVLDGSVTWVRQALSDASLIRVPVTVTWIPSAPMTATSPTLELDAGQVRISALHGGGLAGQAGGYLTVARVTFDDGSVEEFGLHWSISDDPA
jgi:hypothetical protein